MQLSFEPIGHYPRGTLYRLLADAYAFQPRFQRCFDGDWRAFDDFFYDNPAIAERYGFVTALEGRAIGHISWDPRNAPAWVRLGHNCIAQAYKGNGYGKRQLSEAVRRIRESLQPKKILVETNSSLVAARNYESVGFRLAESRSNETPSAFAGDLLEYEMLLDGGPGEGRA